MDAPFPGMPVEVWDDLSSRASDSDEAMREKARDAWQRLREVELTAHGLGGRELFLLVSCAREVVERQYGRFDS
jgi:hypothetical protein